MQENLWLCWQRWLASSTSSSKPAFKVELTSNCTNNLFVSQSLIHWEDPGKQTLTSHCLIKTMASNKSLLFSLILLLIFSSFVYLGFSDLQSHLTQIGAVAAAEVRPTQCIQKLIPCQKYLNKNPNNPPSTCCLPLQDMVASEARCLCIFFNDLNLLKHLNATQDDALKLPKACGVNVDVSKCRKCNQLYFHHY